ERFSQFLKNQGGVKGNRVALYMQNCPQYLIGHYAIQMLGAIVIPLTPLYKEAELEYLINEAKIQVMIVGQELYKEIENIEGSLAALRFVVTTNYTDFLANQLTLPLPEELKIEKQAIKGTFDMLETIEFSDPIKEVKEIEIWEDRSEEHTSELQSRFDLVCRLLLEKK